MLFVLTSATLWYRQSIMASMVPTWHNMWNADIQEHSNCLLTWRLGIRQQHMIQHVCRSWVYWELHRSHKCRNYTTKHQDWSAGWFAPFQRYLPNTRTHLLGLDVFGHHIPFDLDSSLQLASSLRLLSLAQATNVLDDLLTRAGVDC